MLEARIVKMIAKHEESAKFRNSGPGEFRLLKFTHQCLVSIQLPLSALAITAVPSAFPYPTLPSVLLYKELGVVIELTASIKDSNLSFCRKRCFEHKM